MIDQLKKAVYKRFGPVYGSSELKAARDKLCEQCWEVYKQERWAGSVAMEAALQAALPTPEQVAAARAPYMRQDMVRAYHRGIALTLILSAVPILLSAWVCAEAYLREGDPVVWAFFANTALWTLLVLAGALLLQRTSKKAVPILCLVVGVHLLTANLFYILMMWVANDSGKHPHSYDYTDRIGSVESIDLVRLQDYRRESGEGEDCLEYTVMATLAPDKYESLMRELAGLQYFSQYKPPTLYGKEVVLLIRFSPEQSDVRYAFYGGACPGKVIRDGKTERLQYDMYICYDNAWEDLVAGYFPNAPLR